MWLKMIKLGGLHGFRTKSAAKTVQECDLKGAFSAPTPPSRVPLGEGGGGSWGAGDVSTRTRHGWGECGAVRSQCSACGRGQSSRPTQMTSSLHSASVDARWAACLSCVQWTRGCPASGLSPLSDGGSLEAALQVLSAAAPLADSQNSSSSLRMSVSLMSPCSSY